MARLIGLALPALLVAACTQAVTSTGAAQPATSTASPGAGTPSGPAFSPQVQAQLQQVLTEAQRTYHVPGVMAAVNVPGDGTWVRAAGLASTSSNSPVTPATKFRIGSITKTFTATVILQLVQEHKLSLSDPISKWVPNVQDAGSITVQQLLDMTSGIYDEGGPGSQLGAQAGADPAKVWTPQQIVDLAVAHGPAQPPGTFYYSDTNYVILGIIAQDVTGQPIQALIGSRIIQPLHLTGTSYPTTTAMPAPGSTGYVVYQGQVVAAPVVSPSVYGAAGAIISTVGDLETWVKALATGSLLSASTQAERLKLVPTSVVFPPLPGTAASAGLPVQYGLGIANIGGLLGHNGTVSGYTADILYLPSSGATIVVLMNSESPGFASSYGAEVSDAVAASMAQIVLPAAALHTVPAPPAKTAP